MTRSTAPTRPAPLERALALAPDYVDARNNLGNVQKELGLTARAQQGLQGAMTAFDTALQLAMRLVIGAKAPDRH